MPIDDAALAAKLDELTGNLETLNKLVPQVTDLQKSGKRYWKWLRRGGGFIAFDVAITLAGLLFGLQVYHLARDIQVTQQQVLCPQLQLYLGSYSAAGRAHYPQGAGAYDQAFAELRHEAQILHCEVPR